MDDDNYDYNYSANSINMISVFQALHQAGIFFHLQCIEHETSLIGKTCILT